MPKIQCPMNDQNPRAHLNLGLGPWTFPFMPEVDSKSVPLEVSQMTKLQKLAALLIIIGPEAAAHVMKNLGETELEAVATEMVRIPMIPHETQADLLKDFSAVA